MPKTTVPQPYRPGLTAEMDLTPIQERLSGKSLPHEVEALIFSYLNIKDFYILCAVSKLFKSKDSPGQINPLFREQISSLYLPARTLRDNQDVNDWKIMGILTAYNMRDLIELAHEKPSVAHAIMNSRYYLKKLPSIEHYIPQDPLDHNISPHVSRAIKLFNGLIGSLIGLLVGICFSALHVLYAAFTLPLIIMEPEKSFIRSMGGLSIFPAICTLGAISTTATMSYHSGIKSAVGKLMKIFTAFNMIFLGRPVFQDIDAPDHLSVFNQKHASFYLSKRYEGETFRELRRIEGLRSRKTVARSALCFKSPPRLNASPIGPGLASPA
jgi:hypothetical protein